MGFQVHQKIYPLMMYATTVFYCDGNGPITGYNIDRTIAGKDDWKVIVTDHSGTKYRSRGLTAGATYEFRVSAVNKCHVSKSASWPEITAKDPFKAPEIEIRDCKRIKDVRATRDIVLNADFMGNPAPE